MEVRFSRDVKEHASDIFMVTAILEGTKVLKSHDHIERLKTDTVREFRGRYTLDTLRKDPKIEAFRRLYWRFGMDPTKTRPSSEALARRVLSGGKLPSINNIVDSNNVMSLRHLLPIGIYDASKLEGDLTVRIAKERESISKIGGKIEVLKGNELVVSDKKKIIGLGYASSDSDMTKVSPATRTLSILVYGAPDISTQAGQACLEELLTHIKKSSGGTCTQRRVFR